jgi:hypothetical protein
MTSPSISWVGSLAQFSVSIDELAAASPPPVSVCAPPSSSSRELQAAPTRASASNAASHRGLGPLFM